MDTYEIPLPMRGEMRLEGFGTVVYEFEPGPFVPSTPALAAVLSRLAANGVVTVAAPKSSKPAKPAPADEPKE